MYANGWAVLCINRSDSIVLNSLRSGDANLLQQIVSALIHGSASIEPFHEMD